MVKTRLKSVSLENGWQMKTELVRLLSWLKGVGLNFVMYNLGVTINEDLNIILLC